MKKSITGLLLTIIVVAGVFLRIGPVLEERDYWYDEAFTGILIKESWGTMNQMIFADVHPPLYYWLVKPWASVFEYSSWSIRSFSTLMGILTIVSAFWIGRKMFGERAGLLAGLITAISPFAIQYSQEARMYSLFGFLMLWAVWFFYRALKFNEWKDWIWWGVFSGLAYCTHYLSVFFFVVFFWTAVFYEYLFLKQKFARALFLTKKFWGGVGVIAIFFIAWLPYFIPHMLKGNLGWIRVSYLSDLPSTLQIFFFGHPLGAGGIPMANEFRYFFDGSSAGLLILSLVLIIATWLWKKKLKREESFVLLSIAIGTLVLLIVLSHFNLKLYVSRYFMPSAVMLYVFFGGIFVAMSKKAWTWVAVAAVFIFLILGLKPITYNSSWYQVSNFIKEKWSGQGHYVVTTSPFDYTSMRYYIGLNNLKYHHKANPQEDFSGWVVVGNENRLQSIEEIEDLGKYIIVDWTCDWEGLELKEIGSAGDLKICQ